VLAARGGVDGRLVLLRAPDFGGGAGGPTGTAGLTTEVVGEARRAAPGNVANAGFGANGGLTVCTGCRGAGTRREQEKWINNKIHLL
jgi:hypothetical protein